MGDGAAAEPTAKERILAAALELFARQGFAETTMRQVAASAGVSVGLVQHHFGTKDGLRDRVDEMIVATFRAVFQPFPTDLDLAQIAARLQTVLADVYQATPFQREYLLRCMVEDTAASQVIFDALADLLDEVLSQFEASGWMRPGPHREWDAHALMFLLWGPVLLGPHFDRRSGRNILDLDSVRSRGDAFVDILQHGMFVVPD